MKTKEFDMLLDAQLERVNNVLRDKAQEYAVDGDRLHNFKQAASLQGISLREALGGFMAKHTVSIYDMLHSDEEFVLELWEEKITDHINYLILLNAIIREEDLERKGLGGAPSPLPDIPDNAAELEKQPGSDNVRPVRTPTPADLAQRSINA